MLDPSTAWSGPRGQPTLPEFLAGIDYTDGGRTNSVGWAS